MFCFAPEIIRNVCCITLQQCIQKVSIVYQQLPGLTPLLIRYVANAVLDECVSKQADFSKKIKQEMTETEK